MTELNEMWTELAKHQPVAERLGYGIQWACMCEDQTAEAADAAEAAAGASYASDAAYAAAYAANAAYAAAAVYAADAAKVNELAKKAVWYIALNKAA